MTPKTARRPSAAVKEARVAGLRGFQTPTLEAVEKRRWQLWAFAGFSIFGLAAAMTLLTIDNSFIGAISFLPAYVIRILFMGIAAALGLYLLDKEARLRKITRALIDERVLSAALSNRLKEVSILSEVGKAINQTLDIDDVLRMILRSAIDLLGAQEGSIMLADPDAKELVVAYAQNDRQELLEGARVRFGDGVSGWVAANREPLLITGKARPDFFQKLESNERAISSAVSVPLIGMDELYGVLNINDVTGQRDFSEYDLRALGLFAEHAAMAIRNARTFEHEHQALTRMEEVDRMKTEFIATVSHELRTPLTSIIGCAKTMTRRGKDMSEEQTLEFLGMIEKQGERLLKMVEEILSASHIESGAANLRREEVDLVDMAVNVQRAFEIAGKASTLKLEVPERAIAFGDPIAMEQVMSNLVDNAIKYSDGSAVLLRVIEEPGGVQFSVIDQGRGIAPGELPDIFERFRQLDSSATRRAGGVGLGLYIVKNLVEAQGGTISVSSEEGRGSTFTVRFSIRRED